LKLEIWSLTGHDALDGGIKPSLPAMKYMMAKMPISVSKEKRRDCIANSLLRVAYFCAGVKLRQYNSYMRWRCCASKATSKLAEPNAS
jgi:hypothetical protein